MEIYMPINGAPINPNTPLSDLLIYAQAEVQNLYSGEEFMVKDLFVGYEWNRIPKGIRTKLGGAFLTYAQSVGSALLDKLQKSPQNQQRYRRK
jgi:hypothetical protein